MMEGAVYVALFSFLLVCAFCTSYSIFFSLLIIVWLYRLLRLKQPRLLLITLVAGSIFCVRLFWEKIPPKKVNYDGSSFTATIDLNTLKIDGDYLQTTAKDTDGSKIKVQYKLESESERNRWERLIETPIVQISGQVAEMNRLNNFHGFNYQDFLARQHIYTLVNADSLEIIDTKSNVQARIKRKITQKIEEYPEIIAFYLKLFILGENEFDEHLLNLYRSLGMAHILSLSGLHLSFFKKYLKKILLRCQITHETADSFLILFFLSYGWLINASTSMFRAIGQFLVQTLAEKVEVKVSTLSAWAITLVIYLFLFPQNIVNAGFQLSFLLSFLLIIASRWQWVKSLSSFRQALIYSAICNLCSIPILSFHFFEFSMFGFVANILFIPIFSMIIFPLIILLFVIGLILPNFSQVFIYFSKWMVECFHQIMQVFGSFKNWYLVTGRLPIFIYLLLAILVLQLLLHLEKQKSPTIAQIIFFSFLLGFHWWNPIGVVGMIDVGQGDSFFIKEPFKQSVTLIDTGGQLNFAKEDWQERKKKSHLAEKTVIPSLKAQGVSTIDHLIVTHPDSDHGGELPLINSQFLVKNLYVTAHSLKNEEFYEVLDENSFKNIKVSCEGDPLKLKNTDLYFLHPESQSKEEDTNENSLVIWGKIGEKYWLFTGDAGVESEENWLKKYPNLNVDVLKVGHHGSKHSTSFELLKKYQPEVAWISVGENNRYNHPAQEVLDALITHKVTIYRTDRHGAVYYYYLDLPFANKSIDWIRYKLQEIKE